MAVKPIQFGLRRGFVAILLIEIAAKFLALAIAAGWHSTTGPLLLSLSAAILGTGVGILLDRPTEGFAFGMFGWLAIVLLMPFVIVG